MIRHLTEKGLFRDAPVCLVDVGASGGIDGYWEQFGSSLSAVGFDGLVKEVERLNAAVGRRDHRYYAYLVGDKSYQPPAGVPDTQPFARSSASLAAQITNYNYIGTHFDPSGAGTTATETIELDQFFLRDHPADVDFIKIDTDGHDYPVLRGARDLLSRPSLLGVGIESQFHGPVHDESNTFRNIDRILNQHGFSLFDLEVHRYSRGVLPKPFVYRIPAQTHGGQVLWADALYLRDAGKPGYEQDWSMTFPPLKIAKLACFCELFGMEDCAAELLLKYRDALTPLLDVDRCLDIITPPVNRQKLTYAKHKALFEKDFKTFYPPR
jgi:FkbM family methyltransferase